MATRDHSDEYGRSTPLHIVKRVKPVHSQRNGVYISARRRRRICMRASLFMSSPKQRDRRSSRIWRISISRLRMTLRAEWWMFVMLATRRDEKRGIEKDQGPWRQETFKKPHYVPSVYFTVYIWYSTLADITQQHTFMPYVPAAGNFRWWNEKSNRETRDRAVREFFVE